MKMLRLGRWIDVGELECVISIANQDTDDLPLKPDKCFQKTLVLRRSVTARLLLCSNSSGQAQRAHSLERDSSPIEWLQAEWMAFPRQSNDCKRDSVFVALEIFWIGRLESIRDLEAGRALLAINDLVLSPKEY